MNIARIATALLMLAALGTAAHAASERTREQVKAGLAEVVRNEDALGLGRIERGDAAATAAARFLRDQETPCSRASEA
jgi:DNA invertase Pin-like site-specific DNA recombinase